MADQPSSSGSLFLSAVTGAALGAAGLTWWLLSRADRRQALGDQMRRLSKLNSLAPGPASVSAVPESLEERVQRLNIAIDEVRRQLEDLSPEPGN
ncbi:MULTISPECIES: hypothetical protein [Synechococcus]|uniref:hypothetical protein n=1 Tax=Synechococcus TaxID=1129 RepID=UPI0020CEFCB1|nr:hypothetical protein [Synechococcus lacustris]MCP9811125.1 hypothetical protein [Synechococcus lacustris Maggiore-St4-Slac]